MLGVLLVVADFDSDVQGQTDEGGGHVDCGTDLKRNTIGFLVTMCLTVVLEVAVALTSMRGTILNFQPRSFMPYLVYIRLGKQCLF